MRIMVKLKAAKDFIYDLKYYNKLQGFIYSLLKDTPYSVLHDKKGYKYFCFSNIFPIGDMKSGDIRNLIISSPDKYFIKFLAKKLKEISEARDIIHIGEMSFTVEEVSTIDIKLKNYCKMISATPIVIRIPEKNFKKYGIEKKKRRYVYWRVDYSFEAFIKQLEENLFKKYNEFHKSNIREFPIFEQFTFKKEVCNHIIIDGIEYKIIGSIWEFGFSYLNDVKKNILEFGIECGFGERNSLGFGFMNVLK